MREGVSHEPIPADCRTAEPAAACPVLRRGQIRRIPAPRHAFRDRRSRTLRGRRRIGAGHALGGGLRFGFLDRDSGESGFRGRKKLDLLGGTSGGLRRGHVDRRGRIVDWDADAEEHAKKIVQRERKRLTDSFEAAKADGYQKFIMFLHYPPTSVLEKESVFTRMAEEYGASKVIYAHCHGEARFHDSIEGMYNGVCYQLVSGDFLKWQPYKILD